MTLQGHEPAAPESQQDLGERILAFEKALWELIIHLPEDAALRRELLDAGCGMAAFFRARIATHTPSRPTPKPRS